MKKYKVKFRMKNGYEFARYYNKRVEAKKASKEYNEQFSVRGCKAIFVGGVNMESHHTAIARGYCRVIDYHEEYYNGRFGRGYIAHYPTLRATQFRGNNWHMIEYVLEVL